MDDPIESPQSQPNGSEIRAAAERYTRRGWRCIPVPYRSKNPGIKQWEQLRIPVEAICEYFNGDRHNIGVLLGEPSGWHVDVDLDHALCVALADNFLPPTPAEFGRPGKPRSHRIFHVTSPVATKKHKSKSAGMLVELRSTGMQTIFPPSTHESGELISWLDENAQPADVDPDELLAAVEALAHAAREQLGEKQKPGKKSNRKEKKPQSQEPIIEAVSSADRTAHCLAAMLRIGITDQRDGSHRLFVAACRAVEYDLDDSSALATIREYARQRPFLKSWNDDDALKRVRDAERQCRRGLALERDADGTVVLGLRDPESGRLVLAPKRTLPTAEAFVRDFYLHSNGRTLQCYASLLLEWRNNRYCEIEDNGVKKRLQSWLHDALRYIFSRESKDFELVPFESNPGTINSALESIRAFTHLPVTVVSPSWIGTEPSGLSAKDILPCKSKLLHLPTMQHYDPTPQFFTVNALECDPDPSAPEPSSWYAFLHQLFDGDIESLDLLQDWFGYCLTGDTSQQKILLMVGPKRSGKGTIARVLTQLIGIGNVAGPTTSSLAGPFGLQPLIGKTLAIVSDARFHGENIVTVVERLLCISGEDALTIDRKHLPSVFMKLPTRFMFLTNEFPKINDASGALAGRFVILRLTKSFFGKEDRGLTNRLLGELPGILNWAIRGWQRLRERGYFVMPSSVQDVVEQIEDLTSLVSVFVRERCLVGPGNRINVNLLYEAWCNWCEKIGKKVVTSRQTFGRDLAAAVPSVLYRRSTNLEPFYDNITLNTLK